jgi:hypothetical protein
MSDSSRPKIHRKELILFGAPFLVVALSSSAAAFMQNAEQRHQVLLRQHACSYMMYQEDGSMKPCNSTHGMLPLTRWQIFVRMVKSKVGQ